MVRSSANFFLTDQVPHEIPFYLSIVELPNPFHMLRVQTKITGVKEYRKRGFPSAWFLKTQLQRNL